MSEELKLIEGVKVSDVFDFKCVGFPAWWSNEQVLVCGRALRNYDDMKDQITQLEKDKAELVEALSDVIDGHDSYDLIGMTGLAHCRCVEIVKLLERMR